MDRSRINLGELLFQFIAQNRQFLFTRNIFTFMFGGQFQLNVHKSDVRNVNKLNAYLSRARLPSMDRGDASIYQQIKRAIIINT